MTSRVLLGLGAFRFSIDTAAYESLTRDTDFGWEEQARARNYAHDQATTLGSDIITLRGIVYPGWKGGLNQIETMRAMGRQQVRLPLLTGTGRYMGTWIIKSVSEGQSKHLSNGAPRKQEFEMVLKYSPDEGGGLGLFGSSIGGAVGQAISAVRGLIG